MAAEVWVLLVWTSLLDAGGCEAIVVLDEGPRSALCGVAGGLAVLEAAALLGGGGEGVLEEEPGAVAGDDGVPEEEPGAVAGAEGVTTDVEHDMLEVVYAAQILSGQFLVVYVTVWVIVVVYSFLGMGVCCVV